MTTQQHDPGPVPPPTEADRQLARRIRVIAALHAMIQWLTEHPDAPTPHTISMQARPADYSTPDAVRMAALERFAEIHDAERYGLNGRHEYAKVHLGFEQHHGADITYTVSTTRIEATTEEGS